MKYNQSEERTRLEKELEVIGEVMSKVDDKMSEGGSDWMLDALEKIYNDLMNLCKEKRARLEALIRA